MCYNLKMSKQDPNREFLAVYGAVDEPTEGMVVNFFRAQHHNCHDTFTGITYCGPRSDHDFNGVETVGGINLRTEGYIDPAVGEAKLKLLIEEGVTNSTAEYTLREIADTARLLCRLCIEDNRRPESCKLPFTEETSVPMPEIRRPESSN